MRSGIRTVVPTALIAAFGLGLIVALTAGDAVAATYRSPLALAVAPDGKTVYASDRTAGCVVILDAASKKKVGEIALKGEPWGMALSADGKTLYVAQRGAGSVAVIDTAKKAVTGQIAVGPRPVAVAIAEKSKKLYVCNRDTHTVSVVDLSQTPAKEIKRIAAVREPSFAAVTPDEKSVVITNQLPKGVGTDPTLSAVVNIIDTAKMEVASTVKLTPGSTSVYGCCTSPDGKWAYVVHQLGRFNLPVTQLERGWVNTYALTIIDVAAGTRYATMLLDDLTRGAANPYAVVCSSDGTKLWISHFGTHKISAVDVGLVHELLTGKVPAELAALKDGSQPNIWVRIQQDPKQITELENDLTALYIAGAIRRIATGGNGPRGLALTPDNKTLLVANYYAGTVGVIDTAESKAVAQIAMGEQPAADPTRRGSSIFHDATYAFQHWHSCASCHPNDGRVDGLRWDFMRDGIGNAKDTINLVYLQHTPPHNHRATRPNARECVRTGILGSHMTVPEPVDVDAVLAYLVSLRPEPSPYLENGKLSASAARGKALFEGKAACATCHPAPYYTDKKMHNIGTPSPSEPDGRYDTPTLVEGYRTAPYLHDGRAATLKDVLTVHDPKGSHGKAKGLKPQELDDLVQFLLSL